MGMTMLADAAAFLAVLGGLTSLAGWIAVARFAARPATAPVEYPAVTILRPLYGAEPLLEEALASCCTQVYPEFQLVFGLHDEGDPALAAVHRLQARFPDCDIAVVIDPALHGSNRKVSNLLNMLKAARHDVLVISDSDLHLPPNYLERLVAELEKPGTGLVTSVYLGLPPAELGWLARLGAMQITHNFLPGVLLSRALGREDCLGSTAMLRRSTLAQTGGLGALASILAEDNVLGQRVRNLGLSIGLADIVVPATVPEASLRALWHHEIRWTRTIRASAPLALLASSVQYPLFWALMACVLSGGAPWSLVFFGAAWVVRAVSAAGIDGVLHRCLGRRAPVMPMWLLPVRDVLSVVEIAACYQVEDVIWRGHRMDATGVEIDPIVGTAVDAASWSEIGSD
jgi:ceramide glucosyltransferase